MFSVLTQGAWQTFAVAWLLSLSAFAADDPAVVTRAIQSISRDDLAEVIEVLADDSLEGREAGSRGGQAAGGYLARRLARLKLKPAGDAGSYFQSFGNGYRNTIGILRGSDPNLRNEYILIGAHYDHVGLGTNRNSYGPLGYIHNGADDNASGTAAVFEIAEALTIMPAAPARSIIFVFWDGEEKGLLGSKHWVEHPTIPLEQIRLVINLDMVGRLNKDQLEIYGAHSGLGFRQRIVNQNHKQPLKLVFDWNMRADSDHFTFFKKQIPAVMFHTGLHDDYHRPSDDVEHINLDGLMRVARLVCQLTFEIANSESIPTFRPDSLDEDPATDEQLKEEGPKPMLRLGVWWQVDNNPEHPLIVSDVESESPAATAGIQIGDRLINFAAADVVSASAFQRAVSVAAGSVPLIISREGETELRTVQIRLAGAPRRLGISLRDDPANPKTLIISYLDPGSPAAKAGLQVGDRLYRVNGGEFTGIPAFRKLVDTKPSCNIECERDGILQQIVIPLK